jgi:hypothetical protein
MMDERSEIRIYSVAYTCPNTGKRVSRSDPLTSIERLPESNRYENRIVYEIDDCPCGNPHVIEVCGV